MRSNEKCVGVFNHVSYLDPFVLVAAHARVTSIAKAGIDDMPLIGDLGKAVGILFVARRGTDEASGASRRGGTGASSLRAPVPARPTAASLRPVRNPSVLTAGRSHGVCP